MKERFTDAPKNGIIVNNPTLLQLFCMCPTLAISTSLINAIGIGLSVTLVLIGSNVVISLLRKIIPNKIRIAAYVVIIAGFVTTIDMLFQAYLPALSASLGLYLPLIAVNCIILVRAENFESENKSLPTALDGLLMGTGFTGALMTISLVREILGAGTLFGFELFGGNVPMSVLALPAGGFLTLGCIIALVQYLRVRNDKKGGND